MKDRDTTAFDVVSGGRGMVSWHHVSFGRQLPTAKIGECAGGRVVSTFD